MAEKDWWSLKQANPGVKLKKNKITFLPYGTEIKLRILGRCKVTLWNKNGGRLKSMVYVVAGQTESLLGKKDGGKLGIIKI